MFTQASRVLVDNSSLPDGILKIPSPTCFLLVPQPNIEQLALGIVKNIAKPTAFFVSQHMAIQHSLYRIALDDCLQNARMPLYVPRDQKSNIFRHVTRPSKLGQYILTMNWPMENLTVAYATVATV
jgi:hypothetical protein